MKRDFQIGISTEKYQSPIVLFLVWLFNHQQQYFVSQQISTSHLS
jgi:hypothetical protein